MSFPTQCITHTNMTRHVMKMLHVHRERDFMRNSFKYFKYIYCAIIDNWIGHTLHYLETSFPISFINDNEKCMYNRDRHLLYPKYKEIILKRGDNKNYKNRYK